MIETVNLLASELPEHTMPMAPWGFAVVAVLAFILLGLITFSYRDVQNRHTDEVIPPIPELDGHASGQHH
ncbi:hypothetical protein [Pseudoclavibacter caeni]|jgi:hypothetical protein|uniref:Uncharacterized protein n=1 Tax=Pseudoclavibacter caeni TaxID=908846 RepID=A0A7C8FU36_9MICO|nr:hypothetical protein [Pseudoclavibacter caeni]KAB1632235.1 hypothetical protein F8O02_04235 [Pseudoclavibacter caeni]NYJ97461.1 hypothetical protein [Pseudoclavibacter caeni]